MNECLFFLHCFCFSLHLAAGFFSTCENRHAFFHDCGRTTLTIIGVVFFAVFCPILYVVLYKCLFIVFIVLLKVFRRSNLYAFLVFAVVIGSSF